MERQDAMTDGEKMDGVFIIRESKIELPHKSGAFLPKSD
jgi:hypothetical protein